jgi:hypothetical protein
VKYFISVLQKIVLILSRNSEEQEESPAAPGKDQRQSTYPEYLQLWASTHVISTKQDLCEEDG